MSTDNTINAMERLRHFLAEGQENKAILMAALIQDVCPEALELLKSHLPNAKLSFCTCKIVYERSSTEYYSEEEIKEQLQDFHFEHYCKEELEDDYCDKHGIDEIPEEEKEKVHSLLLKQYFDSQPLDDLWWQAGEDLHTSYEVTAHSYAVEDLSWLLK